MCATGHRVTSLAAGTITPVRRIGCSGIASRPASEPMCPAHDPAALTTTGASYAASAVTRHRAPDGDFLSARWSADGRHFVAVTASQAHIHRETAKLSLTPFCRLEGAAGVQWFDGERVIVTDSNWRTLSIAEKGGASRRLFPLEEVR